MHEPETDWEWSCVVLLQKRKCDGVTTDGWRCKLLAVWKTCVQTDRRVVGGVRVEDRQRQVREARWRVTGPAVTPLFIYLFINFLNPLRRSLVSLVGPQSFPTRKTNLWSSRLRRLVQKRWMPFFFFKRKGNAQRARRRRIEYEDASKWGSEEVRWLVCGRRRQDLPACSSIVEFLVTLVLRNKLLLTIIFKTTKDSSGEPESLQQNGA